MHIYDLTFTDGKTCRCIIPEPESEAQELASMQAMFGGDRLKSMTRIVAPPPEKLPWKRSGDKWVLHRFELRKLESGYFRCEWPGGSIEGGGEEISAGVRANWADGC